MDLQVWPPELLEERRELSSEYPPLYSSCLDQRVTLGSNAENELSKLK